MKFPTRQYILPFALGILCALLTSAASAAVGVPPWPDTTEILLWPNGAPGSENVTAKENYSPPTARSPHGHLSPVHYPSVFVFLPPKEKANGAAVLICPGGGFNTLTIDHEGRDIAKWFNSIGVAAFVVKYRLSKTPGFPQYTLDTSIGDVERAMRLVRSRAADWGVDPKHIGLIGFSAGGAVAAYAGLRYDAGHADSTDPIEHVSSRPDFQMLIYPGTMDQSYTVPKDAPPLFLAGSFEDAGPAAIAIKVFSAYQDAKIPAEIHIYTNGVHGFALETNDHPVSTWNLRLQDWLNDLKLLTKK
jgi:endo-1,4-beta-xylanase